MVTNIIILVLLKKVKLYNKVYKYDEYKIIRYNPWIREHQSCQLLPLWLLIAAQCTPHKHSASSGHYFCFYSALISISSHFIHAQIVTNLQKEEKIVIMDQIYPLLSCSLLGSLGSSNIGVLSIFSWHCQDSLLFFSKILYIQRVWRGTN